MAVLGDGDGHAAPAGRERAGPPASLLLLADGRFPSGGHAHSGGLEAATRNGRVHDLATLETFLLGRIATAGAVAAAFAGSANANCTEWTRTDGIAPASRITKLEDELDARTPSLVLRETSRRLGRQLLRSVRAVRPDAVLEALDDATTGEPHQPLVLGAAARVLGLGPYESALIACHEAATGPATAAVRLLGIDPFGVHSILSRLAPRLDELAHDAAEHASCAPEDLPCPSAPNLDISAEHHGTWKVRLFAS